MPLSSEFENRAGDDLGLFPDDSEYRATYESGVAVLENFLSQCSRPPGAAYGLFAMDPEGRLQYVCSSDGAFNSVHFPDEITTWPECEDETEPFLRRLPTGGSLNSWVGGLPPDGSAAWHRLQSPAGVEGLLLFWWPARPGSEEESLEQFRSTIRLTAPFLRIWQNDRRHQRRYLRLKALEEISLAVASSLDLDEVLLKTRDTVVGSLGFDRASIYTLDEGETLLRGSWGTAPDGCSMDISNLSLELVRAESDLARVARGEMDYYLSAAGAEAPRAIVPLRSSGRIVGVIAVDNGLRQRSIREDHLRVLLPFAAHAGAAVHNARMHERLAAHLRQAEEMEQRRKNFEREVVLSVTDGKLHLCEPGEIQARLGTFVVDSPLGSAAEVSYARQTLGTAAKRAGLSADRRSDFELCLGEAATNCFQHATGGLVSLHQLEDVVQIRLTDQGPGIQSFLLPRAMLMKGYSTKTSLGMGFSMMLSLCDTLYLTTSPAGTDILIEMTLEARDEMEKIWEQLGFDETQAVDLHAVESGR